MLKVLLFAFLSGAAWGSDVLDLTDDNFVETALDAPLMLVEFFAPWCGHCKKLAPEYEIAATKLKGVVPLAKVDCTENTGTCAKYKISGYPTLTVFRNGADSGGYEGARTAAGIIEYLKKRAGPPSDEIKTAAELKKLVDGPHASIVGLFSDDYAAAEAEYMKAADYMREHYRFAHSNSADLLKKYEIDGAGILLFRPPQLSSKFEDSMVKLEEELSSDNIKQFIVENVFGLCPHMTEENREALKSKDLLIAYYNVDYENDAKGTHYWRNRVMKVGKSFLDEGKDMNFAVANKDIFESELSEVNIVASKMTDVPMVLIRSMEGNSYIMKEEFSRDGKALERFMQAYFDGKVERFIKSEPIPEDDDGPVRVVVGKNFDAVVDDPTKDVLIEFYAPWCGHCKTLEPKLEELGERLAGDPNVVIAKMDATVNSVPFGKYVVRGFPTIYFSPAGTDTEPKEYEGGREVEDFIDFLEKEVTNPPLVVAEAPKKKKKKKSEL